MYWIQSIIVFLKMDLSSLINNSQISCLNESDDHTVKNILEKNTDLYLESDCDPEVGV